MRIAPASLGTVEKRLKMGRWSWFIVVCVLVGACSSDTSQDGAPDAGANGLAEVEEGPACDAPELEFESGEEYAIDSVEGVSYVYMVDDSTRFDSLQLEVRIPMTSIPLDEPIELNSSDFASCEYCLWARTYCDGGSRTCREEWIADAGRIEFSAAAGQQLTFTLEDVHFTQVRIDRAAREATPWNTGERCLTSRVVDVPIQYGPVQIGQQSPDYEVRSCETGEMMRLTEIIPDTRAVFLVGTTEWCSACRQYIPNLEHYLSFRAPESMTAIYLLGEDYRGFEPSIDTCQYYAEGYDIDPSRMFIDYTEADGALGISWNHFQVFEPLGFPWVAILRGRTYEYMYSDGEGGDAQGHINEVLSLIME